MRKRQVRMRLWIASVTAGTLVSLALVAAMTRTGLGGWMPGIQPGWLLGRAASMLSLNSTGPLDMLLTAVGNAAFYTWFAQRVIVADILSRGPLGRFFLPRRSKPKNLPIAGNRLTLAN